MSWLAKLYETYEVNTQQIGVFRTDRNGKTFTLLPVSHTTQQAQIEVTITEDGEFHSAEVVNKHDANTVIPATDQSTNRTSGPVPHPLHDKLMYVAGDFKTYSSTIKKSKRKTLFEMYMEQLEEWVHSPYATNELKSIYTYLSKQQLVQDLVRENVLHVGDDGKLLKTWGKEREETHGKRPLIFSVVAGDQDSAFVRFAVRPASGTTKKLWEDHATYKSFLSFYSTKLGKKDLCYIKGEELPSLDIHPSRIRGSADQAKLISANDTDGFTYKGRFLDKTEVVNVSYEASQKIHNALKWLIQLQGRFIGNRLFLAWGSDDPILPDLMEDSYTLDPQMTVNAGELLLTERQFAEEITKSLSGFKGDLSWKAHVNILILDSTMENKGRLAVLYYQTMNKQAFLDKLKEWHSTYVWLHTYRKDEKGKKVVFYGAPTLKDIAHAAHGPRENGKVIKHTIERLLPCILNGHPVPHDIIRNAVYRASNPVAMERSEWEKTLSITCAMLNKQEGYQVSLNHESNDRSYVFGRLLAIADVIERWAIKKDQSYETNVDRYMQTFANYPERTWRTIRLNLQPYISKLEKKDFFLTELMMKVTDKIPIDQLNDEPLSGKFLLGFSSQWLALNEKKQTVPQNKKGKGVQ